MGLPIHSNQEILDLNGSPHKAALSEFSSSPLGLLTTGAATPAKAQQARANLEFDEHGRLTGYFDPTTLTPEHDLIGGPQFIPLNWEQGFPITSSTGMPFWERLENESYDLYKFFAHYRDLRYGVYTSVRGEAAKNAAKSPSRKNKPAPRDFQRTADAFDVPVGQIAHIADVYCWYYRVHAYDKYHKMAKELRFSHEAEEMESRHAKLAERLLDKVTDALEEMDPEDLTPQAIGEWIKSGVALERISRKMEPTRPSATPLTPEERDREEAAKLKLKEGTKMQVNNNGGALQIVVAFEDSWQSS